MLCRSPLEPDRRVLRVDEPLLRVLEVVDDIGSACSRATAPVGDDVVLDKASGDIAVDTVAEKQVGGSGSATNNLVLPSSLEKLLLERSRVLAKAGNVLGHEYGHHTGGVGASHRGTGKEVDNVVTSAPGAEDLLTRGEDVDALANVGEGRNLVLDVDRANSDDVRVGSTKLSRSRAASVGTIVTSSNRNVNASLAGSLNHLVDCLGSSLQTPRHAHDRTDETGLGLALLVVGHDEIHTGNGVGRRTRAVIAEDLDSNDVGTLGNTKPWVPRPVKTAWVVRTPVSRT
jgi:hypothetical protein